MAIGLSSGCLPGVCCCATRASSSDAPACSVGQQLPGWPLLWWQRRRPEWRRADDPSRDLTASGDPDALIGRVVAPPLRTGEEPLAGLPTHSDEPPRTSGGRAPAPRTRCSALDGPGPGPHNQALLDTAFSTDGHLVRP